MQKQSFQELAAESDQAFRQQFDPNSTNYHKGLQTPVPLNGSRVPQSMTTVFPQGYDPNQVTEVIDYGQGYRKVQENRNTYLNLKKSLAKLCPVVEAFLRHQQIFKEKGDPNNQSHRAIHQQNIKKQKINLEVVNTELEGYLAALEGINEEGKLISKQLKEIIAQSRLNYDNKQSLANFNFKVKKVSTQTFSHAQKCLQRLKDIKKEYAKNNKKQEKKEQDSKN